MSKKPRTPGCPRCRMDLIRFLVEVQLPRFTMRPGEEWDLPQHRYREDGSIHLGHGIALASTFEIVERDHTRACHNLKPCPGDEEYAAAGYTPTRDP